MPGDKSSEAKVADERGSDAATNTATLRGRAVRGGAIVAVARLVAQIFNWSVTLFVARLLFPDDYGIMTYGTLFLGLADMLAELGVGRALVQKKELLAGDLAQGFTLSLLLSTLLYGIIFFAAIPAAHHLERPEFTTFLRVLALCLFYTPWRSIAGAVLEREMLLGRWSGAQLIAAVLQGGLVLWMAWSGFGYWALACGALAGQGAEAMLLTFASGWKPRLALPSREARELIRFGVYISASGLLWFIYSNADFAVLGSLLGPAYLGYYALAFQFITLPVQKITSITNQIMFNVYCRIQGDRARLRDWFLRLMVLQDCVAFPVLAGMGLVADDAIPLLLGNQWRQSVLPLQLLCPIGALMMLGIGLSPVLNAIGRPDINFRYSFVCALVLPAGFYAAGWWGNDQYGGNGGIAGVCLAWIVLFPVLVIGRMHLTRSLTSISPFDVLRTHLPILMGLAMMAVCVLTAKSLAAESHAVVRLIVMIGVGVISYSAWMLATARNTVLADVGIVWRELRKK